MPSECQVEQSWSSISVAYLWTIRSVAVWQRTLKHLDNPKHCKAINSKAFLYILAKSEVLCLSNKHTQASYVCVFCVVLSVTISTLKRCSVRLYLQLSVGGLMSYLYYMCLFTYSGVQHISCCVFVNSNKIKQANINHTHFKSSTPLVSYRNKECTTTRKQDYR
jgi:hypothetical protein